MNNNERTSEKNYKNKEYHKLKQYLYQKNLVPKSFSTSLFLQNLLIQFLNFFQIGVVLYTIKFLSGNLKNFKQKASYKEFLMALQQLLNRFNFKSIVIINQENQNIFTSLIGNLSFFILNFLRKIFSFIFLQIIQNKSKLISPHEHRIFVFVLTIYLLAKIFLSYYKFKNKQYMNLCVANLVNQYTANIMSSDYNMIITFDETEKLPPSKYISDSIKLRRILPDVLSELFLYDKFEFSIDKIDFTAILKLLQGLGNLIFSVCCIYFGINNNKIFGRYYNVFQDATGLTLLILFYIAGELICSFLDLYYFINIEMVLNKLSQEQAIIRDWSSTLLHDILSKFNTIKTLKIEDELLVEYEKLRFESEERKHLLQKYRLLQERSIQYSYRTIFNLFLFFWIFLINPGMFLYLVSMYKLLDLLVRYLIDKAGVLFFKESYLRGSVKLQDLIFIRQIFNVENLKIIEKEKEDLKYLEEHENRTTIELKDLYYILKTNIEQKIILKEINLKITPQTKIAIIGKTGSGKSTLCSIIAGLDNNYSGEVLTYFHEPNSENKKIVKLGSSVLYLVQTPEFFSFDIKTNIFFNTEIDPELLKLTKLDAINLNKHLYHRGLELSGGQKQKIAFARMLNTLKKRPYTSILILDEAFSAVDLNAKSALIKNLLENYKEKTILYVTHDFKDLEYFDTILGLDNGKIVFYGDKDQYYQSKFYQEYEAKKPHLKSTSSNKTPKFEKPQLKGVKLEESVQLETLNSALILEEPFETAF